MKMILVKYREHNTIEGYVENESKFKEWLKGHNQQRKREGESSEKDFEFELIEIKNLIEE